MWKEKLKDRDLKNFYHLETEEKAVNAVIAGTNICLKGGEGERYDLLHCSFFDVRGGKGFTLSRMDSYQEKRQQIAQTSKSKQTCTIFSSFTGSKGDT